MDTRMVNHRNNTEQNQNVVRIARFADRVQA